MTENHPITPPPELLQQWLNEEHKYGLSINHVASEAAQWGANQELEACCNYFTRDLRESLAAELRAARRPKPPSLKEQALLALNKLPPNRDCGVAHDTIRRALEQLPE